MTMRTSIDAYKEITENGLLAKKQMEVYKAISVLPDCTINDLIAMLGRMGSNTGSITGRISELKRMGVIAACGEKVASTGQRVTVWRTTINLPAKLPWKETSREKIARLEYNIEQLKEELAKFKGKQTELFPPKVFSLAGEAPA